MAAIKQQVYHAHTATLEESRSTAMDIWLDHLKPYPDFREGVDAFVQKRAPRFRPVTRADVNFSLTD